MQLRVSNSLFTCNTIQFGLPLHKFLPSDYLQGFSLPQHIHTEFPHPHSAHARSYQSLPLNKTKQKNAHQIQSLSLSPWQNPHPVKKLHNAPRDYFTSTQQKQVLLSLVINTKFQVFRTGRGCQALEKLEISVHRFCSVCSVKLKSLGSCFQVSVHEN